MSVRPSSCGKLEVKRFLSKGIFSLPLLKRFLKEGYLNPPHAAEFTPPRRAATNDAVAAVSFLIGWGADLNVKADSKG